MSLARSCFAPSFTYKNISVMFPLIKLIRYMIAYFIRPIALWPVPVKPESILLMSTCSDHHITPERRHLHRHFPDLAAALPRCRLMCATGASMGKGVTMLGGGLFLKFTSKAKYNPNWWQMRALESCQVSLCHHREALPYTQWTTPLTFGTTSPSLKSSQSFWNFGFICRHHYQKAIGPHEKP